MNLTIKFQKKITNLQFTYNIFNTFILSPTSLKYNSVLFFRFSYMHCIPFNTILPSLSQQLWKNEKNKNGFNYTCSVNY